MLMATTEGLLPLLLWRRGPGEDAVLAIHHLNEPNRAPVAKWDLARIP